MFRFLAPWSELLASALSAARATVVRPRAVPAGLACLGLGELQKMITTIFSPFQVVDFQLADLVFFIADFHPQSP